MDMSAKAELIKQGYLLLKQWNVGRSTREVAQQIGLILDTEKVAINHKVSTVQTLRPLDANILSSNTYSGTFGRDEFPLHTDYAHWNTPPRYLILRCVKGSSAVSTHVLPFAILLNEAEQYINRAVIAPRRKYPSQSVCTMPVIFYRSNVKGFRWDSLFLKTLNAAAKKTGDLIRSFEEASIAMFYLVDPFDTLIIDNWRVLHGRSSVPANAEDRNIERIYLSSLW